jgi:hypothetical protein
MGPAETEIKMLTIATQAIEFDKSWPCIGPDEEKQSFEWMCRWLIPPHVARGLQVCRKVTIKAHGDTVFVAGVTYATASAGPAQMRAMIHKGLVLAYAFRDADETGKVWTIGSGNMHSIGMKRSHHHGDTGMFWESGDTIRHFDAVAADVLYDLTQNAYIEAEPDVDDTIIWNMCWRGEERKRK